MESLFAVGDFNPYAKLPVDVFSKVLRAIDAAVLASGTSERKHE